MDQSLQNKVVLVSGAARGIGASEARLLAARGAKVVLGDVLDEAGRAVAEEILDEAGRAVAEEIADACGARSAVYVHLDATSAKDWAEAVAVAEVEFGRLDFLINNAGIHGRLGLEETTEDEWSRVIDADLKSA
jgi:3alpha(or 20beta)-hydroxysteroid dehydrogenase